MSDFITALSSTRGWILRKTWALAKLLVSTLCPYFFALYTRRPFAFMLDTQKPKTLRELLSTAIVTDSGLHFVCSKVSRSSNSIIVALGSSAFLEKSRYSAFIPRNIDLRTTVMRFKWKMRAALRKETPEASALRRSSFFWRFFCPKQSLKVA